MHTLFFSFRGRENQIIDAMTQKEYWRLGLRLLRNSYPSDRFPYCRIWDKPPNPDGYGQTSVSAKAGGRSGTFPAHRVSKKAELGKYVNTNGYDVSHTCHVRLCINPDHLRLEKRSENNRRKRCKLEGRCLGHGREEDRCINLG